MSAPDRIRARRIVRRAAKLSPSARSWLLADERGTWERMALEYLEKAAANPIAATMTEDAIDGEIASVLVLLALEALRHDAMNSGAARPSKRAKGR